MPAWRSSRTLTRGSRDTPPLTVAALPEDSLRGGGVTGDGDLTGTGPSRASSGRFMRERPDRVARGPRESRERCGKRHRSQE